MHPITPKTTLTKDKKRKNRNSEEKELRGKNCNGCTLNFYIGYVFGRKENCLMEEVYLTTTF